MRKIKIKNSNTKISAQKTRLTKGKKLPRSIVDGLLLDQARRCVEDHRQLMANSGIRPIQEVKNGIANAYKKMFNAIKAYECESGRLFETSI